MKWLWNEGLFAAVVCKVWGYAKSFSELTVPSLCLFVCTFIHPLSIYRAPTLGSIRPSAQAFEGPSAVIWARVLANYWKIMSPHFYGASKFQTYSYTWPHLTFVAVVFGKFLFWVLKEKKWLDLWLQTKGLFPLCQAGFADVGYGMKGPRLWLPPLCLEKMPSDKVCCTPPCSLRMCATVLWGNPAHEQTLLSISRDQYLEVTFIGRSLDHSTDALVTFWIKENLVSHKLSLLLS
jgi:hypothetical protein